MVKQYDVFRYKSPGTKLPFEFVIVLQSVQTSVLRTVISAPVGRVDKQHRMEKLHVPIEIEGKSYFITMPELGAFPVAGLQDFVSNVSEVHADVMSAIDLLFAGF